MEKELIQQLKQKLKTLDNVKFAYLFGSYATDKYNQNSDIDIAIYLNSSTLDNILQINYELSKLTKKDIDLTILNKTKNIYLLDAIFRDGILLKDNPDRIDYEILKEHEILDYKEFRKIIDVA